MLQTYAGQLVAVVWFGNGVLGFAEKPTVRIVRLHRKVDASMHYETRSDRRTTGEHFHFKASITVGSIIHARQVHQAGHRLKLADRSGFMDLALGFASKLNCEVPETGTNMRTFKPKLDEGLVS